MSALCYDPGHDAVRCLCTSHLSVALFVLSVVCVHDPVPGGGGPLAEDGMRLAIKWDLSKPAALPTSFFQTSRKPCVLCLVVCCV